MRYDVIILAVILGVFLFVMHMKARRNIRIKRRETFTNCLNLFSNVNIYQDDVNFPVLTANYKGLEVKLEPLVDHIAVRKIPSLWLLVTVKSPIPYSGTIDYLVRPQNTEFYSPSNNLDSALVIPQDWPQHATLRTNNPSDIPPLDITGRYVRRLFKDTKTKELLITPRGIRIVYQADQALRSNYMVLRQLVFENHYVDCQQLEKYLDNIVDLLNDLCSSHKNMVTANETTN